MKALVTGATGFIGGHLAQTLQYRGYDVRLLVRPNSNHQHLTNYQLHFGDVTQPSAVKTAVQGVDVVFHVAAIRDKWGIPYRDYYQVNVEGTRLLLNAAAEQDSRFVYCSSVGVMGHPGRLGIDESFPYATGDGKYNYSHTKGLADEMTLDDAAKGRLFATVVRPVITYGPGDTWGMVTRLIDMLAKGKFMPVGNGQNYMHLAYISDIVEGFLLAAQHKQANGKAYIIAGPAPVTLNDLIEKVCKLLKIQVPARHVPQALARIAGQTMETLYTLKQRAGISAGGDVPFITRDKVDTLTINRSYSTAKAEAELGYKPSINYDQGLPLTVDWWRNLEEQNNASGKRVAQL